MRKLVVFVAFMSFVALTACGGKETPVKDVNSTEVSVGAETDSKDEFDVNKIKEILEYSVLGEKDKITSLSFENGEIKGVIELAPNKLLSAKDLAVTSYSRASDALLEKEGWEVLTMEYVNVGNVSMKRSEKETNEHNMDYFPTEKIKERLK